LGALRREEELAVLAAFFCLGGFKDQVQHFI
jgi:hypothetical protein